MEEQRAELVSLSLCHIATDTYCLSHLNTSESLLQWFEEEKKKNSPNDAVLVPFPELSFKGIHAFWVWVFYILFSFFIFLLACFNSTRRFHCVNSGSELFIATNEPLIKAPLTLHLLRGHAWFMVYGYMTHCVFSFKHYKKLSWFAVAATWKMCLVKQHL
jgi:hypothetical protein